MKDTGHYRLAFSIMFLNFLVTVLIITQVVVAQNTTITSVNVGVVLNLNTLVGKIGLSCIQMALSDFYASHSDYRTRLVLHVRDSEEDTVAAAAAAIDLIKNVQVQAILGPQTSTQANFVSQLGKKAQVPIITFSATNPSLASTTNPYFIRATLSSSSQVKAIATIIQSFGWREVVPIHIDNEYGAGIIPFLVSALQEVDARVTYRSPIAPSASNDHISEQLYRLMTMQTRVFVLHATLDLGSRIVSIANDIGMMSEGYVWILTDGMTNFLHCLDPLVVDSLQGALGVTQYAPQTSERKSFTVRWKRKFHKDYPEITDYDLTIHGLWAHDATKALAMAMEERVGTNNNTTLEFHKIVSDSANLTDLENMGISRIGPELILALSSTRFKGLAGDFHLVNGEQNILPFQILNVAGNTGKSIGFWTPDRGLIREMGYTNGSNSDTKSNLGAVIWPGDGTAVPKGWEVPTNGRILRIGVPAKAGFKEFINVTIDHSNRTMVSGYCIDVFDAVMKALPYAVRYEYIPFAKTDGSSAGTYNDLIYQVYLKKYDAVVGDTTILANRSQYVDFTLPFTESGVSMVVPVKDNRQRNAWVFLRPLTWDLWAASACFFIFIGFAVWVLEHRINEDFRGPPAYQIGTSFWFSFSTMVFAHRERVMSNLGRFVVIIWAFVVLILTQSYTASLTSMLTVQQLQPTVSDLSELYRKGYNVGYLKDSFVLDILKKHGFEESKLRIYNSTEECERLLTLGSKKDGIAAAVDETPYMRLFLAKNCSKYTTVEQIYKTDGFGFVFPKGSPLVPDISRAILKVTEGEVMEKIEKKWLGTGGSCQESLDRSPPSLGLDSFKGLFLIVGVAASMALALSFANFLKENKDEFDPQAPLWRRIGVLFRRFDEKDLNSHTMRKIQVHEQDNGAIPPPTPSRYSTGTDSNHEQPQSAEPIAVREATEILYNEPEVVGSTSHACSYCLSRKQQSADPNPNPNPQEMVPEVALGT